MAKRKATGDMELAQVLRSRIRPLLSTAPWVLRVTEYKDKPIPVLVVKERFWPESSPNNGNGLPKAVLRSRGQIYGQALRRCLPIIRAIVSRVADPNGIPLDLHRFIANGRIEFRGNLPLDEEAGAKLGLIFKLQERLRDMDRAELIAWRVERFSREEAVYWLTRATQYGQAANRWAQTGMRIMLAGQSGDKAVLEMLDKLRG